MTMRALFTRRDARLYIGGQTLSTVGDNALWLAMAIWIKELTGSDGAAGLTFLAFTGGQLLAPAAGLLADRLRKGRLLVVTSLLTAVLVCMVAMGAGALLAGLLAAPAMRTAGERAVVTAGLAAGAAACPLLMTHTVAMVLAGMPLLGLCIVWFNTGATTLIQHRTPLPLVGRVDAAVGLGITVPQTLSIALGAALITILSYRTLLLVMTLLIGVSAVYLGLGRERAASTGQAARPRPACSGQPGQEPRASPRQPVRHSLTRGSAGSADLQPR